MTSVHAGSWPASRPLLVAACLAATAGCATMERVSSDASKSFEAHVTRPVRYRLAAARPELRAKLDAGHRELDARDYRAAIVAFNQALWELEHIRDRGLRLSELRAVYEALARAYYSLGILDIAEDQRWMARALDEAARREPGPDAVDVLRSAKETYAKARFQDAGPQLRRALVGLEDIPELERRVAQLAHARCYLALSHFAVRDHQRVREELRRLWALDATMGACVRESPPGLRAMIDEIQRKPKDL
jgi:hypothetical protein